MALIQAATTTPEAAAGEVKRVGLRMGAGVGVACVAWMAGLHATGNNAFGPKLLLAQLLVPMGALVAEWVLRRRVRPAKPGLGRALGVGLLTVAVAAVVSSAGLWGMAAALGEPALARHRTEMLELLRVQQRDLKMHLTGQQVQEQRLRVEHVGPSGVALNNFVQVLLLGLVLAVPGGIFLRE